MRGGLFIYFCVNFPAFSISSENSQVVMIAISAAVAIILLTVVVYVLIGRLVCPLFCTFTPSCIFLWGLDEHGKSGIVRGSVAGLHLLLCLLPLELWALLYAR